MISSATDYGMQLSQQQLGYLKACLARIQRSVAHTKNSSQSEPGPEKCVIRPVWPSQCKPTKLGITANSNSPLLLKNTPTLTLAFQSSRLSSMSIESRKYEAPIAVRTKRKYQLCGGREKKIRGNQASFAVYKNWRRCGHVHDSKNKQASVPAVDWSHNPCPPLLFIYFFPLQCGRELLSVIIDGSSGDRQLSDLSFIQVSSMKTQDVSTGACVIHSGVQHSIEHQHHVERLQSI